MMKKKKNYATRKFAAGTCGIEEIDSISGCGNAGAGAGPVHKDVSHECSGDNWLITATLPPEQVFVIALQAPDGPTILVDGQVSSLARTMVTIPTELLKTTIDSLDVQNNEILLTLEVSLPEASHFSIPQQEFAPNVRGEGFRVAESRIENSTLHLDLAIARQNLGAFLDYALDLQGLKVEAGSLPQVRKRRASGSGISAIPDVGNLTLLVELSSATKSLANGAEIVGKLEPTLKFTLPMSTLILAALLVLSWLLFLSWRTRQRKSQT